VSAPAATSNARHVLQDSRGGHLEALAIAAISGAALVTRLPHVLASSLPVGDGGLFYLMARGLSETFPRIPTTVSYGSTDVPTAYPPLGFFVAVAADWLGPWDLTDVFRFLPLTFSVLSVLAAWLVLRELCPWPRSVLALALLALIPRSWNWEVVGGGITRSPGLFFLLLALSQAVKMGQGRGGRLLPLWTALALLFHPEMGLMALVHPFFFAVVLTERRNKGGALLQAAMAAAVAIVLSAPWWGYALARHGPETLLGAATGSRYSPQTTAVIMLLPFSYGEPGLPWLALLGLLGVLGLAVRRDFLAGGWLLFLFLVDPRKAATVATLPLALGAAWLVGQAATALGQRWPRVAPAVIAAVLTVGVVGSLEADRALNTPLRALASRDVAAMVWIRDNTAPDSRVLVLAGLPWATDPASEWLPAVARRESVLTVQGSEWLGKEVFWQRSRMANDAARCLREGTCSGGELAARFGADLVLLYSGCDCPRATEGLEPLLPGSVYVPSPPVPGR